MSSEQVFRKAYQIISELMNENCFDFIEVEDCTPDERKQYLRKSIFDYFHFGETCLGGIIKRVDDSLETIQNVETFFNNEELIETIIFLMDEDTYFEYEDEINKK